MQNTLPTVELLNKWMHAHKQANQWKRLAWQQNLVLNAQGQYLTEEKHPPCLHMTRWLHQCW